MFHRAVAFCLVAIASSMAVAEEMPWIAVSADRSHFVMAESGERFVPWGVNYDHDGSGRLIEDYWVDQWPTVVEDFAEIKALGANVVRVHLQLGRFMKQADQANRVHLDKLADLITLANESGLYLNLTGLGCYHKSDVPAWYDALDESDRWKVQATFWREIALVCRGHASVFCYDLMNEPVIAGGDTRDGWLAGELGGKHFVQRIALKLEGRTRQEIASRWIEQLTESIRKVDDRHLITVGVIPWAHVFKGAKPLFHDPQVGRSLDFVSVHFYPKSGEVDQALNALKVYDVGKPLVVEEMFPLKCGTEELMRFVRQSSDFCDGWFSFYWGETIQENQAKGDIGGAIKAQWLQAFQQGPPEQ
ncbi:MAG: cellulase family glycosylhydrolase [Pirellulaceae bacterium]